MPCRRTISLTYNCASLSTPQVSWMSIKRADFVSLSTRTQIAFFLEAERSNPIIKSINIESHFQVGISKGLSSPTARWYSAFTFWHVKYLSTYSAISLFTSSHQKNCLRSLYIFVLLGVLSIECYGLPLKSFSSTPLYWARTVYSETSRFHLHVL